MAIVLAQMWDGDNHMDDGWWWVMGIGWLLFLAFIGILVYLLVRHHTDSGAGIRPRGGAPQRTCSLSVLPGARSMRTSTGVGETRSVRRHRSRWARTAREQDLRLFLVLHLLAMLAAATVPAVAHSRS